MKYVVILGDGMADFHQPSLNDKTPLMLANKPCMDSLAPKSIVGLAKTVPCGMKPGSDVANLSVLGYDPEIGYTGRSPLEAASIGIDLKDTDVTVRTNLVTLSNEQKFCDKTMVDYSGGEISTREAKILIEYLKEHLDNEEYTFFAGISYRHCLVIENGTIAGDFTPPHDITGKPIKDYLPKSEQGKKLLALMEKSHQLLKDHPVNLKRVREGKNPANSIWLWGEGTKPSLEDFKVKYGVKGAMISAVDLLKGMGKIANMQVVEVEGATGNYDTNFEGKAEACLEALDNGCDFVYVHVEAPDECGHHGDAKNKIYSIEQIDQKIIKRVIDGLEQRGEEFALLIAPDHPTPISTMTHCSDPIPFMLYRSGKDIGNGAKSYDEDQAKSTGLYIEKGHTLVGKLLSL
ncbi:MAG: cofactor-independent phosphoglycerate mutase [Clostridia bacterium]|nr:cofactor-independent phosphoglycerate mutase [Clostridia bacterium]